ncbi:MAG: AI-2E family transporter [Bacteroidales bacterium]
MTSLKKYSLWIVALLVLLFCFYFFTDLIVYILIAFILSIVGRPMVLVMKKYLKIPKALGSVFTLLLITGFLFCALRLILPLLLHQTDNLTSLNYQQLSANTYETFTQSRLWLATKGIVFSETEVENFIFEKAQYLLGKINIQNVLGATIGFVTSSFISLFSILFIAFFFLKDELLFRKMIFLFVPESLTEQVSQIIDSSQNLLTRYFVGLCIEVVSMMTLLTLGLWLLGVENALLYGCLGGLLNVIPYLGPVLGATVASIFASIGALSGGITPELGWLIVKVVSVFALANLVDNFVLQPLIYANSVKAHPLEIFFVVMMAATLGGVIGMIVAIPIYTLLRIIAKEMFKNSVFVQKITRNL